MTAKDEREPTDDEIDALVADALGRRGELIPTSLDEVDAAERDGVSFEGELPPSLRELPDAEPRSRVTKTDADQAGPAHSQRVVSLEEARRARASRGGASWGHVATFVAGAAVAAGVTLLVRAPGPEPLAPEPGAGPAPSASSSATPEPDKIVIGPLTACADSCCAGAACAAAKGELKACASGRTCVGCDAPAEGTAYQIRLGNLVPTEVLDKASLEALDLCGRVLGGEWSCVPAYAPPSAAQVPRVLAKLASSADLANGLEVELRPRGTKTVLGRWRDSVRLGATVLCRGLGALVTNDDKKNVGSLAMTLDDPYRVEIARAAGVGPLKALRARIELADITPFLVETSSAGDRRYALAAGPFDKATAEKLRWALAERSQSASVVLGEDYAGAPLALP